MVWLLYRLWLWRFCFLKIVPGFPICLDLGEEEKFYLFSFYCFEVPGFTKISKGGGYVCLSRRE